MANSKPYWSIVLSSKNLCENNWLRYQLYPSLYFPLGHCLYFALQSILFKGMDEGLSKVWLISLGIVSLLLIVACVQPVLSAINNILDSDKVYIQRKIKNDVFIQEEENEVYFQEEMSLIDFCSDNSGLSSLATLPENALLNILPQILPFWKWYVGEQINGWCIERRAAEGVAIIWRATYPLVQRSQHMDMQTDSWGVQRATISFNVFLIKPKLIDFSSPFVLHKTFHS